MRLLALARNESNGGEPTTSRHEPEPADATAEAAPPAQEATQETVPLASLDVVLAHESSVVVARPSTDGGALLTSTAAPKEFTRPATTSLAKAALQSVELDTGASWAAAESEYDAASWNTHWATEAVDDGQYATFIEVPLREEVHSYQQPWSEGYEQPYGAEYTLEALHWSNPSASRADVDECSQSPELATTATNESTGTPTHEHPTTLAATLVSRDVVGDVATPKPPSDETPMGTGQLSLATAQTHGAGLNQVKISSEKPGTPETLAVTAPSTPVDSFML